MADQKLSESTRRPPDSAITELSALPTAPVPVDVPLLKVEKHAEVGLTQKLGDALSAATKAARDATRAQEAVKEQSAARWNACVAAELAAAADAHAAEFRACAERGQGACTIAIRLSNELRESWPPRLLRLDRHDNIPGFRRVDLAEVHDCENFLCWWWPCCCCFPCYNYYNCCLMDYHATFRWDH